MKKVDRSGAATKDVLKAKDELEVLNFLTWLAPFLKARSTKTNLPPMRRSISSNLSSPTSVETSVDSTEDESDYNEVDMENIPESSDIRRNTDSESVSSRHSLETTKKEKVAHEKVLEEEC